MSDIERNKQRRLRFLRAVYDLAEGVPSHSVRGVDVAEQLSLSVDNEEFQGLAYYNQKAGYTEALETNWGLLVLTIRGIAEVERNAAAASHQVASTLSTQRPDAGYTELLPDRHRVAGHGEISRKTARTLAQIVLESFSYSIDEFSLVQVDHESLYDFLYENDYPIWFVEDSQRLMDGQSLNLWIMKLHTGTTISDLFPDLQPAQVHELGQTYLQKLSGDILNYYAEESDEVELQQTEYPAEVQYLQRRLELDGFIFRDSRLLTSDENVLAEEESGVLESLYRRLNLQNEKTAFHHLDLSEQHYLAGRWDDSISNSRKFLESVLREVATAHSLQEHDSPLSQSVYEWPKDVRNYLEKEKLISHKEKEALFKVYGLLSDTGGHPYMARSDQARLLRNLALTLSQFIMLRFQGSSGKT